MQRLAALRSPSFFVVPSCCTIGSGISGITKSCQDAPLLAVGRNGILVRGFGGQIPPTEQMASFHGQVEAEQARSAECPPALKAPPLAAGIFTRFSSLCKTSNQLPPAERV